MEFARKLDVVLKDKDGESLFSYFIVILGQLPKEQVLEVLDVLVDSLSIFKLICLIDILSVEVKEYVFKILIKSKNVLLLDLNDYCVNDELKIEIAEFLWEKKRISKAIKVLSSLKALNEKSEDLLIKCLLNSDSLVLSPSFDERIVKKWSKILNGELDFPSEQKSVDKMRASFKLITSINEVLSKEESKISLAELSKKLSMTIEQVEFCVIEAMHMK